MKVIDLLNKIANDEELPKKIEYNGDEWKLGISESEEIDYLRNDYIELFNQYLDCCLIESLNEKVEILKDEETNIQEIEELNLYMSMIEYDWQDVDRNRMKINEIIRVVNKMQEDKK